MNSAIRIILLSLTITLAISVGFGYVLSTSLGFFQGTILAFLLQIILFYVYSLIKQNNISKVEEEHYAVISEIAERSLVNVECPCGVKTEQVPYFDIGDAVFTCEKCSSKFRIEVVFNSVLLTEPLNLENAFTKIKEKELR